MFSQKTYQLRSSTRWLLSVIFLFSFFSFSSYIGHSPLEQSINPIELVSTSKSERGRRTIAYKNVVRPNDSNIHNFSKSWELYCLRSYNRLEEVKFDDYSDQVHTVAFFNLLYQVARMQQNSKEYPSLIALG